MGHGESGEASLFAQQHVAGECNQENENATVLRRHMGVVFVRDEKRRGSIVTLRDVQVRLGEFAELCVKFQLVKVVRYIDRSGDPDCVKSIRNQNIE